MHKQVIFVLFRMKAPRYRTVRPPTGPLQRLIIKKEVKFLYKYMSRNHCVQTAQVRPIGLAAVLRNITFTAVSIAYLIV